MNKLNKNAVPIISITLMLTSLAFLWALVFPVDVLKDWTLSIPKDSYNTGETMVITTKFRKIKNITGISRRYLVCESPTGSLNRLLMSEGQADRAATEKPVGNEIYVIIPTDIPSLPATCHVEVVIEYRIYSFRRFVEHNRTEDFKVNLLVLEKAEPLPTQETDNEVVENAPKTQSFTSEPVFVQPEVIENTPVETPILEESPLVPPPSYLGCVGGQDGLLSTLRGVINCL